MLVRDQADVPKALVPAEGAPHEPPAKGSDTDMLDYVNLMVVDACDCVSDVGSFSFGRLAAWRPVILFIRLQRMHGVTVQRMHGVTVSAAMV